MRKESKDREQKYQMEERERGKNGGQKEDTGTEEKGQGFKEKFKQIKNEIFFCFTF